MTERRVIGYTEHQRVRKSRKLVGGFVNGARGGMTLVPAWQPGYTDHVVMGQRWVAEAVVPAVAAAGERLWHIDNGFTMPGRGSDEGFYRVTLNSPGPEFFPRAPSWRAERLAPEPAPWRTEGSHVLIALPGPFFGLPWGLDMQAWSRDILGRVRARTDRPVRVRTKETPWPISHDLAGCWAVVTHSSNAAVDAVLAGVPVVCEPTCPTAPLGNVGLEHLEAPVLADRGPWLNSLMCQQFSLAEFRLGTAWEMLNRLRGIPV